MPRLRIESDHAALNWNLAPPERVFFLLIAVFIIYQLFIPPIVGLADNGDYVRITQPLGLVQADTELSEKYFGYLVREYAIVPRLSHDLLSTQYLLAELALRIDRLISTDEHFDLTVMGGVNLAFYLLGIYLILVATATFRRAPRYLIGIALVIACTDLAYVAYFNSFYTESASLIFLVILIGLTLCHIRGRAAALPYLLAIFLAAALFVGAKPQNYPLALPLAVFLPTLRGQGRRPVGLKLVLPLSLALMILAALLSSRLPAELKTCNLWNAVFTGILVDSPTPRGDLKALGLDPGLARYRGKSAFDDGVPVYELDSRLRADRIASFHLRHPGRLVSLCRRAAQQAFVRLPPEIGHFEKSAGRDWGERSQDFSFWHDCQSRLLPSSLLFLIAFFIAVVVGSLSAIGESAVGDQNRLLASLFLVLVFMAAFTYLTCILGDGCYELSKHLFLFQALFDICLVAALAWVVSSLNFRSRRRL